MTIEKRGNSSQELYYMTQIFKSVHTKSHISDCQSQHMPTKNAMLSVFYYHKHNCFLKCMVDRNRQREEEQKIDFPR